LVSQRVEVKLGIRRAGQVEITEGLKEGEQIVIAGQQRLQKDGTVLRVVELGRGPANAASAAASSASATSASAASANAASGAASR
jgi:membrane fusion protein (multidrug efflux system)